MKLSVVANARPRTRLGFLVLTRRIKPPPRIRALTRISA
jgi:hypothetical protein